MKQGQTKPTNKDRDSALSHMLGRMNYLESLLNAQIEVFDNYTEMKKDQKKFQKYLEKKMEKVDEERRILEEDGPPVGADTEDAGRGTEGICED